MKGNLNSVGHRNLPAGIYEPCRVPHNFTAQPKPGGRRGQGVLPGSCVFNHTATEFLNTDGQPSRWGALTYDAAHPLGHSVRRQTSSAHR